MKPEQTEAIIWAMLRLENVVIPAAEQFIEDATPEMQKYADYMLQMHLKHFKSFGELLKGGTE